MWWHFVCVTGGAPAFLPQQQPQLPPPVLPSTQIDVNDLFTKLLATGILKKDVATTGSATNTPPPELVTKQRTASPLPMNPLAMLKARLEEVTTFDSLRKSYVTSILISKGNKHNRIHNSCIAHSPLRAIQRWSEEGGTGK